MIKISILKSTVYRFSEYVVTFGDLECHGFFMHFGNDGVKMWIDLTCNSCSNENYRKTENVDTWM